MKSLIYSAFILLNSCSNLKIIIKNDIKEIGLYNKFYTQIPMSTGSLNSQRQELVNEEIIFKDSVFVEHIQLIIKNAKAHTVLPSKIGMNTLFGLIILKNNSKVLVAIFENMIIDVDNNVSYTIEKKLDKEKMKEIIKENRN